MSALTRWLAGLLLVTILIFPISQDLDLWLAKWTAKAGVAAYVHGIFVYSTRMLDPLVLVALVAFLALGVRALSGRPLTKSYTAPQGCCFALVMAEQIKDVLKGIFSHGGPSEVIDSNGMVAHPANLKFHWLSGAGSFNSFPSGHMGAVAALLSVLWLFYPRARYLYAGLGLLVAAMLVLGNFHFLSDVLAGACVGGSVGLLTAVSLGVRIGPF